MTYLRNAWYPAAWDSEVEATKLLKRVVLEEAIVFFRDEDGAARALADRCPHRYAPLSMGKIIDGAIECPYHGLRFNAEGRCVLNPQGDKAPPNAQVDTYPVVERHRLIWIWMGAADRAAPDLIPDLSFQDAEVAYTGQGYLKIATNYQLEIDNILDLSHVQFLHATTLGSTGISSGVYTSAQEGDLVWSRRKTTADVMSGDLGAAMGFEPGTLIDRWLHVSWQAPANLVLWAGAVPTGRPSDEGQESPSVHLFTPETATSTHYWFGLSFPRAMGPMAEAMAHEHTKFLAGPFTTEDQPILEAQQRNLGSKSLDDIKPVWLPGDAAGSRARQNLARLIAEECAGAD